MPPLDRITARSSLLTVTAGRDASDAWSGDAAARRRRLASVMRWPSLASLKSVNSRRSAAGRYSLIDVAMIAGRRFAPAPLDALVERRERHDRFGTRRLERLFQLTLAVGRIQRARRRRRSSRCRIPRPGTAGSWEQQRDAVALANTQVPERCRTRRALAGRVDRTRRSALEQQRGGVAVVARERVQVVDQRLVRYGESEGGRRSRSVSSQGSCRAPL